MPLPSLRGLLDYWGTVPQVPQQDPVTTQLSQEDTYGLPLNVKRGMAKLGHETPDFAKARVTPPGMVDKAIENLSSLFGNAGQTLAATAPLTGRIAVFPEMANRSPADIEDLLKHEQTHREQRARLGPFGMQQEMVRESALPYQQRPLEAEAFQSMRDLAAQHHRPSMFGIPNWEDFVPSKSDIYLPPQKR